MNEQDQLPKTKIRGLGNGLLLMAILGIIGAFFVFMFGIFMNTNMIDALFEQDLAEITDFEASYQKLRADTTAIEILEQDRDFLRDHRGSFNVGIGLVVLFMALYATIFIRMALAWRRGDVYGTATINGLRYLGITLIAQFVISWIWAVLSPAADHSGLMVFSELHAMPMDLLSGAAPTLSAGIVFLILSMVLNHGRKLSEEQSLTI